jgi:hypothetical protein
MKHLQRLLSLLLSLSLIMLPMVPAQAALVGNGQLIASASADANRTTLLEALDRDSVRQQLSALGVTPEQAQLRVNQMTDQEVAQLNQQLANLPAGGDVVGILVLILIIFIITDVIGATDIFPFIHPVR